MSKNALPRQADDFPAWYAATSSAAPTWPSTAPVRGSDGDPPVRLRDLGARSSARSTTASRPPATRTSTSRCSMPVALLAREARPGRGLRARDRRRHAGRRLASSPSRSSCAPLQRGRRSGSTYGALDPVLPRPAAATTTSGRTSSAGSCAPASSCAPTEFLWQEGHTAHETRARRCAEALLILHEVYARRRPSEVLALPVLRGRKSAPERFPGARRDVHRRGDDARRQGAAVGHFATTSARASRAPTTSRFTGRGRAPSTSLRHLLGRLSTRLDRRARVMAHGDDRGLRAAARRRAPPGRDRARSPSATPAGPPRRRPPWRPSCARPACAYASTTATVMRAGAKFHEWELRKGVPVRLELGPRDIAAGARPSLARRDRRAQEQVALGGGGRARAGELLDEIQRVAARGGARLHTRAADERRARPATPRLHR